MHKTKPNNSLSISHVQSDDERLVAGARINSGFMYCTLVLRGELTCLSLETCDLDLSKGKT
jgi:hypothetical protein